MYVERTPGLEEFPLPRDQHIKPEITDVNIWDGFFGKNLPRLEDDLESKESRHAEGEETSASSTSKATSWARTRNEAASEGGR